MIIGKVKYFSPGIIMMLVGIIILPTIISSSPYHNVNLQQDHLQNLKETTDADSAYIYLVRSDNPDDYLFYISRWSESYFSGLAACRYILLELRRGALLEPLVNNLNRYGMETHLISLNPLIRNKPEHLMKALVFPEYRLRLLLKENYSGQLEKDPYVDWFVDYNKNIHIPFDALHLLARKQVFRIGGQNLQFLMADSAGIELVKPIYPRLNSILENLSRKLQYDSTAALQGSLTKDYYLWEDRLTIFVYDSSRFKDMYQLKQCGWSYPDNGLIYIDPTDMNTQEFLQELIHQITHIYIAGNIHNIHHNACRWFDEGFAQWTSYCYTSFQGFEIPTGTYRYDIYHKKIREIREKASRILTDRGMDKLTLSEINSECRSNATFHGTSDSRILTFSIILFLSEKYDPDKILEVAARISHSDQNVTERSLKMILNVDYKEIEKLWQNWLVTAE